ncbi:MAG TPA: hypothetical protein VF200_02060 [Woeseiaceae bacterium]
MKIDARSLLLAVSLPVLLSSPPEAPAQDGAVGLVAAVRDAASRYKTPAAARDAGYEPILGCVSAPEEGAMGLHFANGALVADGVLDASQPELLVYEPKQSGGLRLVAVEFVVIAEAWDAANEAPPVLDGQLFNFVGAPNRYGLPPFYELHVWAFRENPHGMFVDWNPQVTCEHFAPVQ